MDSNKCGENVHIFRSDAIGNGAKGKYFTSENAFPSIMESCTHNAETNTLANFMNTFSAYSNKIQPTLKYEPFIAV